MHFAVLEEKCLFAYAALAPAFNSRAWTCRCSFHFFLSSFFLPGHFRLQTGILSLIHCLLQLEIRATKVHLHRELSVSRNLTSSRTVALQGFHRPCTLYSAFLLWVVSEGGGKLTQLGLNNVISPGSGVIGIRDHVRAQVMEMIIVGRWSLRHNRDHVWGQAEGVMEVCCEEMEKNSVLLCLKGARPLDNLRQSSCLDLHILERITKLCCLVLKVVCKLHM